MSINAQTERRKAHKQQKQRLFELNANFSNAVPHDRPKASSEGVRQVVSLSRLPTLSKRVTVNEDEVTLCWKLKAPDKRALKMILLIYEANGWTVES